jgi:hypothetical protein
MTPNTYWPCLTELWTSVRETGIYGAPSVADPKLLVTDAAPALKYSKFWVQIQTETPKIIP